MDENQQEVPQTDQPAEAAATPDLVGLLSIFPGSPGQDQMEAWKLEFGEIFCSGFSETELFIWRPLSRREYVSLQKQLRTPPSPGQDPMNEFDYQEAVVSKCMLWSSQPKILGQKGGSYSTLSEQVMMNSNFLPPAVASSFVVKL